MSEEPPKTYLLLGPAGPYRSAQKGALGGNRKDKLYGRLDCPSALRALANGHYQDNAVFFADEQAAVDCRYRPCARCLPAEYAAWKAKRGAAAKR